MDNPPRQESPGWRPGNLLSLARYLLLCLAVAALGGLLTSSSVGSWYQGLNKPSFNPPDWVFAPVWTTLFVMMAVAAWRISSHQHNPARAQGMVLFYVQLALNLLWSCLFFGLQSVGAALVEIVILWGAIAATMLVFRRIDRVSALLLWPYLAWVSFAGFLNWSIWRLN